MSTTKSAGSTRLGRDSQPKYLGVKLFAGEKARVGQILIRQRGTKWVPGKNVRRGADDTLYAVKEGVVSFKQTRKLAFNNTQRFVKVISVL